MDASIGLSGAGTGETEMGVPAQVLVTGASGFIGTYLVPFLRELGFEVTAGLRSSSSTGPPGAPAIILGDLWDYEPEMDLSRFDAVVHLAGPAHGRGIDRQIRPEDYAGTVLNLAQSASLSGVRKFIYVSSVKAVGDVSQPTHPLNESSPPDPTDWYGRAKRAAELGLQAFAQSQTMSICVLRPPLVYDSGAPKNFGQLLRLAHVRFPLPIGSMRMPRSLLHRENMASAIAHLLSREQACLYEEFFARDGRDVSPADAVRRLRGEHGRPSGIFSVPLLNSAIRLFGGAALSDRLVRALQVDDRKLRSSGWEPRLTLGQGLARTVAGSVRPKRLLMLISEDWYFLSHRRDLALAAIGAGWEVHVACRVGNLGQEIQSCGIHLHALTNMDRKSGNPLRELRTVREITELYRQIHPDVVHHVALKPIIYGSMAARRNGLTSVINALAGMGSAFTSDGRSIDVQRRASRALLSRALRMSDTVVVQNSDDAELVSRLIGVDGVPVLVVPGSGTDISAYPFRVPPKNSQITVCYSGRMLLDKGVVEFVRAVDQLAQAGFAIRGLMIGKIDPDNPSALSADDVELLIDGTSVEWLGQRSDVNEILSQCDIAVLASYREGLPKSLLEAASIGLPMVATDVPGCREIVQDGVTGCLVPPRDVPALAGAIRTLVESPELRRTYGLAARELVERRFSRGVVIPQFLDLYENVAGLGRDPTG